MPGRIIQSAGEEVAMFTKGVCDYQAVKEHFQDRRGIGEGERRTSPAFLHGSLTA